MTDRNYNLEAEQNTPVCDNCNVYICYWCDYQITKDTASIDHIDGNKNNKKKNNLVLMHKNCNSEKGQENGRSKLQSTHDRIKKWRVL